ncbi:ABC transporter permease [Ulvibacter antarcticus]|uniref:Putative ABC transport system permease protein n=1 Tax=Ulvibacter antarcticus TaxID=442714 RepID=A0A3L9YVN5_9FLAO|nr:ABC transporter permease [Ulvibacter antarcticus]RMA64384.1 putative ABC transport system permease protein [Ulvibacter antarcticus]
MLKIWFKIFYRNSKKNWLNLLVNISGLTLGLAGLLIVMLYFNDENSYNQWNPNKDDVYRIANESKRNGIYFSSTSAEAILFKSDIPEVEETVLISPFYRSRVLKYNGQNTFTEKTTFTEPEFFNFFPFEILEGSSGKFLENRKHIALSKTLSEEIFGDKSAIGNLVTIDEEDYTVSCVYEVPGNSHYESDLLIQFSEPFELHWGNFQNELFCKLTPGADVAEVKSKMNNIIIEKNIKPKLEGSGITLEEFDDKYGVIKVLLENLGTIRLHHKADYAGPSGKGNYQLLLVLTGLSLLLILISCVNFINLSTASASQRAKEVGVKKTLGLSKKELTIHYILEVLVQGFMALLFALLLVELILPYFNEFIGKDISIFNGTSILKIVGVAFFTSLFIGLVPAIYVSKFKSIEVLKGNYSRSKKGVLVRNAMLALQFLISGFFLIGVLVIYSQIHFMINKDLGFDKDQTLVVDVFNVGSEYQKYELAKQVLSKNSNILDVSASMFVPGEGNVNGTNLSYGDVGFNSGSNLVDFNYIDFAKLKVLKGRGFSEAFSSDTISSIVINETAAKRLGIYDDPIGKKLRVGWMRDEDNRPLEVIGMIQDYHFDGFDTKIDPMFLLHWNTFSFSKDWLHAMQFKVKSDDVAQTISAIEDFWKVHVDSEYPFSYGFLDKKFAETYDKYQKQQTMFLILSIMVIIISLLGLFALATLTIQQRLKEVAIRKTLGASAREIILPLINSFLKITVIASLILLPIAYFLMQNWLDNFVYRIDMPIWPYIVTPILLLVLVFSVVGFKAYHATKIDLIKYLKFE